MDSTNPILAACRAEFQKIRHAAEHCLAQFTDEELHVRINPHQNSAAVIIQHLAGNMRSRWTDFLTADGEKPGRDRESEFAERRRPRAELLDLWQDGWNTLFSALDGLHDADLARGITIRGERMPALHAILRQVAHYSLHLGQLQVIGKHLRGERWEYLSIAPGGSAAYNARMSTGSVSVPPARTRGKAGT